MLCLKVGKGRGKNLPFSGVHRVIWTYAQIPCSKLCTQNASPLSPSSIHFTCAFMLVISNGLAEDRLWNGINFEYCVDLNTELVWFSNGLEEVGCQMVQFSNAVECQPPLPFKYRTNGRHLVFSCTGLVFKWSIYYT